MAEQMGSGPPTSGPVTRVPLVGHGTRTNHVIEHDAWSGPLLSLLILACITLPGSTRLALLVVGLVAAGVVLTNVRVLTTRNPAVLALTANLSIFIAFPFGQLPHDRLTSYVVVFATAAIAASALLREPMHSGSRGRWYVASLFALLALSSVVSPDVGAVKQLATSGVAALPCFLLAGDLGPTHVRDISRTLVTLAVAESVLAGLEPWFFPQHLWLPAQLDVDGNIVPLYNPFLSSIERAQGTLGHPLQLGFVLVLALALLVRVLHDIDVKVRLGLTVVLIAGLLLAGDRSALISAVAVVLIGRRLSMARLLAGGSVLFLALGVLLDLGRINGSILTSFSNSGSWLHRTAAYSAIARLAYTQSPAHIFFGNGFASTQRMFAKGRLQTDGFRAVDNQFVLIQSQGGLVCLLVFVALLAMALFHTSAQLRSATTVVLLTMFIFDAVNWTSASALTFLVLGAAMSRTSSDGYLHEDAVAGGAATSAVPESSPASKEIVAAPA